MKATPQLKKEREVLSTKFRNILSLYLRSLWAQLVNYILNNKKKKFSFFILTSIAVKFSERKIPFFVIV
jgi:hypothetical protein